MTAVQYYTGPEKSFQSFTKRELSKSSSLSYNNYEKLFFLSSALSSWTTSKLPSMPQATVKKRLEDARIYCKVATSKIAMHIYGDWRKKFFGQLDELLCEDDWPSESQPIEPKSFDTLLKLITVNFIKKRPAIGISDTGNFMAAWINGQNRLTIECFCGDTVHYVVSSVIDDHRETATGTTQLTRLFDVIAPFHPELWFQTDAQKV